MIANIQATASKAQRRFIARCGVVAKLEECPRIEELRQAAIDLTGSPATTWDVLYYDLNCWQRVQSIKSPADAAPWFDRLAESLGSDVRWAQEVR